MLKMNTQALIAPIAIALIAGTALVGCSEQNGSGAAPQSSADDHGHDHAHGDHDHDHGTSDRTPDTYSGIRGEITQLPDPSVPGSQLKIHHEQIPDFKTVDGTISVTSNGIAGMRSMTMPFPLSTGLSIEGYSVGDKVEFEFVVNWGNDRPAWEITSIEKLPADTVIDYTNVIQEGFDEAAQDMMDHDHSHDHDGP
jgi:hypothetical protein